MPVFLLGWQLKAWLFFPLRDPKLAATGPGFPGNMADKVGGVFK